MIQLNTRLRVSDNSGAKDVKCIKITGGSFSGSIGDRIMVATQKVLPGRKLRSGEVFPSIIVRQAKEFKRRDGTSIKFYENSAVLLTTKGLPLGTRIFGPVPKELRAKNYMKIVAISQGII